MLGWLARHVLILPTLLMQAVDEVYRGPLLVVPGALSPNQTLVNNSCTSPSSSGESDAAMQPPVMVDGWTEGGVCRCLQHVFLQVLMSALGRTPIP